MVRRARLVGCDHLPGRSGPSSSNSPLILTGQRHGQDGRRDDRAPAASSTESLDRLLAVSGRTVDPPETTSEDPRNGGEADEGDEGFAIPHDRSLTESLAHRHLSRLSPYR